MANRDVRWILLRVVFSQSVAIALRNHLPLQGAAMSKYLDLGPTPELKLTPVSDEDMRVKAGQLLARESRWATTPIVLPIHHTGEWTRKQRFMRWWRSP